MATTITSQQTTGATTWTIDPAHSAAEFAAKHMMITTVRGRIADVRGTITLDEANPERSAVEVELDAASIDTRSEQRDAHLRSADFLDVEHFPTITFRSRRVEGVDSLREGEPFRVVGDLTIRDVTREVVLDAELLGRAKDPWGQEHAACEATTKFKRSDYGLTWNAALETGGVLVGDEVKVSIEVQLIKQ